MLFKREREKESDNHEIATTPLSPKAQLAALESSFVDKLRGSLIGFQRLDANGGSSSELNAIESIEREGEFHEIDQSAVRRPEHTHTDTHRHTQTHKHQENAALTKKSPFKIQTTILISFEHSANKVIALLADQYFIC